MLVALAAGAAGAAAGTAPGAADAAPGAPPRIMAQSLGLGAAVQLTLEHDPAIRIAEQNVGLASGQHLSARGLFEGTLEVRAEYSVDRHEAFPFLIEREEEKRSLLRSLASGYAELNEQFLAAIAQGETMFPACPEGLEPDPIEVLEARDRVRSAGVFYEDVLFVRLAGLEQEAADVLDLCDPDDELGPRDDATHAMVSGIDQIMGLGLDNLIADNVELQKERLALGQHIAEAVAKKAELALARNGAVPADQVEQATTIDVGYRKRLRNGLRLDAAFRLLSSQRNFAQKSLDPSFGGMGIRNEFPSLAAVGLSVPLGKGRGAVSAAAPERAAEKSADAQRELLHHTMTAEVFATVLAYLDLAVAQRTQALLAESGARQQQIAELTAQLVNAGDLPGSELDRVKARVAIVNGAAADQRIAVLAGRIVLANAIGAAVDSLGDAPLAADALRDSLPPLEPAGVLVERALAQRWDRRALGSLCEGQRFLTAAAQADLKRQFDLVVSGGLSTLYESPFFRHLPDELDPDQRPTESPLHFDEPAGYWRSLQEDWKPFVKLGFSWDFPFGNNAAKGQFVQQSAALASSEIQLGDLGRSIQDRVVDLHGRLELSRQMVAHQRAAVAYHDVTLAAAIAAYRGGEISLIDVLTTEENLTAASIQLVRSIELYLSLLARLRFEVGTLLDFTGQGDRAAPVQFDPRAFVVPR
jgi:outer membrane protein TolC